LRSKLNVSLVVTNDYINLQGIKKAIILIIFYDCTLLMITVLQFQLLHLWYKRKKDRKIVWRCVPKQP